MQEKLERLIKAVYKKWKSGYPRLEGPHPDEEVMASFLENRLPTRENESMKSHLLGCDICAEIVAAQLKLKIGEEKEVPVKLLRRLKDLAPEEGAASVLEIFLRLKNKALELLATSGDILLGHELLPLPVLRGRKGKEFKDEVTILKEFGDIRVEAKIENRAGRFFDLTVVAVQKKTQERIKDLRITLVKDDLEVESYSTDSGRVIFEHLFLGKYMVEISSLENKIALIVLDIKT